MTAPREPDSLSRPQRRALAGLARRFFRLFFRLLPFAARAGLEGALTAARQNKSDFDGDERTMLSNVLKWRGRTLADLMIPRQDIVAISADASGQEAIDLLCRAGHSRLPVFRRTLDEPVGILHIRDALKAYASPEGGGAFRITDIMREPLFAPPSMLAADLLRRMQAERSHLTIIVDEHGGTCGLASIEDLVEEIVGEIEDEHDASQPNLITRLPSNRIEASALAPIAEVEKALNCRLPERPEDIRTLGGFIITRAGRVPAAGEKLRFGEIWAEILEADARRVARVRLRRAGKAGTGKAGKGKS